MPIDFSQRVKFQPVDKADEAARRLEAMLNRFLPPAPPKARPSHERLEWRLRDEFDSKASGDSTSGVFADFREHGLKPYSLFHYRTLRPLAEGSGGVLLEVFYHIRSNEVWLEIKGSDRTAVDGVTVACQRIKESLEKPADPNGPAMTGESSVAQRSQAPAIASDRGSDGQVAVPRPIHTIPSSPSRQWLKDNLSLLITTSAAGVLTAVIVVWLKIG